MIWGLVNNREFGLNIYQIPFQSLLLSRDFSAYGLEMTGEVNSSKFAARLKFAQSFKCYYLHRNGATPQFISGLVYPHRLKPIFAGTHLPQRFKAVG
jgi:hypothetical protein